jgi:hypothetical protein
MPRDICCCSSKISNGKSINTKDTSNDAVTNYTIEHSYVEEGLQNSTRSGNRIVESEATATCSFTCVIAEKRDITGDIYGNYRYLSEIQ